MSTVHALGGVRVINSAELYRRCRDRENRAEQSQLWALHIQRNAVTLVIGVTSTGKTTFLHNLAFHLATGKPFLGITPVKPLRVLYVDFESHDGVLIDHFEAIGTHPNLDFVEPDDLPRGPQLIEVLKSVVRSGNYDVVIVDPLMDAYRVEDENDNAQAMTQMLAFRALARSTHAGVVVVHNAGRKAEETADDSAFLGRGATARPEKADVGINFVRDRKTDQATHRVLVVAKSRQKNLGERIEFRFADNLGYELVSESLDTGIGLADGIMNVMADQAKQGYGEVRRDTIRDGVGLSSNERDKKSLTRALDKLVTTQKLSRPRDGVYTLPGYEPLGDRNA
jgi:KaiC/GvpD/RAD55 family RecA-like ATPase